MSWIRSALERMRLMDVEPVPCFSSRGLERALRQLYLPGRERPHDSFAESIADIEGDLLLDRLSGICDSINEKLGDLVVREYIYAQPQRQLRLYEIQMEDTWYEMSLTRGVSGVRVQFSTYRPPGARGFFSIYFSGLGRRTDVLDIEVNPAIVTGADLEQWFAYLISGLRRAFRPRAGKGSLVKAA